jgi:uncharacterized radical SAM superfamily Fe-S cluster-containing enzyme
MITGEKRISVALKMEENQMSPGTVTVLGKTTAYCTDCRSIHAARYEEDSGKVIYSIDCPHDLRRTVVSTDPTVFTVLRCREAACPAPACSGKRQYRFYLITLTDSCNFECPICYAEAGPHGRTYRSVEQVRQLALRIKADGGRRVSLSGGEPTLHPHLPEIVRMVRHEIGLSPVLVTNGLKLSEDPRYARVLKAAGLRSAHLQFDTLDPGTYYQMRGRSHIGEKFKAVDNVRAAGLRLGLVVTVCQYNLSELGRLVDYACSLVPALRIIVFQPAVPVGRFPENMGNVTREDVIRGLVQSGSKYHLRTTDFFPFLPVRTGLNVPHADCSAHAFLCVKGEHAYPLGRGHRQVAVSEGHPPETPSRGGLLASELIPSAILDDMRSALRQRQWRPHYLLISIMAFMRPDTRDERRISRCIVAMVNEDGIAGLCEHGCGGAPQKLLPPSGADLQNSR